MSLDKKKIFVSGNLKCIKGNELKEYFSHYGKCKITKRGDNYAIMDWEKSEDVERLLRYDHFINNVRLNVRLGRQQAKPPDHSVSEDYIKRNLQKCQNVAEQCHLATNLLCLNEWDIEKRNKACNDIMYALREYYPNCKIYLFGSSVNGFGLQGCDMDILFEPSPQYFVILSHDKADMPRKYDRVNLSLSDVQQGHVTMEELITMPPHFQVQFIHKIVRSNWNYRMFHNPLYISAKCPIVKLVHSRSNIQCDISCSNKLVLCNTMLMQFYGKMDNRVRPLMLILRYWAKRNHIIVAGSLSSYAFTLIVIFFLQTTKPRVLLPVQDLKSKATFERIEAGWNCAFCDDLNEYEPCKNEEPVEHLLLSFFEFLERFDFSFVISPLCGYPLERKAFSNLEQKGYTNFTDCPICIQDPLECCRNITTYITVSKLIHLKKAAKGIIPVFRKSVNALPQCPNWGILSVFEDVKIIEKPLVKIRNECFFLKVPGSCCVFSMAFNSDLKECLSKWKDNKSCFIMEIGKTLVDAFENSLLFATEIVDLCDEYPYIKENEEESFGCRDEMSTSNVEAENDIESKVFSTEVKASVEDLDTSDYVRKCDSSVSDANKSACNVIKTEIDTDISYSILEASTPSQSQSNSSTSKCISQNVKNEPSEIPIKCDDMPQKVQSDFVTKSNSVSQKVKSRSTDSRNEDVAQKVKIKTQDVPKNKQDDRKECTKSDRKHKSAFSSYSKAKVLISVQSVISYDVWRTRSEIKKSSKNVKALGNYLDKEQQISLLMVKDSELKLPDPLCFSCSCLFYRKYGCDKLLFVLTPFGAFDKFQEFAKFVENFLTSALNDVLDK